MLIYIWFRFKDIVFAGSAVLALLHDVIVVLLVYAAAKISVGNTFIACMLTIVGYSINATIVIFDRIRENIGTRSSITDERLSEIVNDSITQTLTRRYQYITYNILHGIHACNTWSRFSKRVCYIRFLQVSFVVHTHQYV